MPITDTEALVRVIEHREIFHDEMLALMRRIMRGEMSPLMVAALAAAWVARRGPVRRALHWLDRAAGLMFIGFGLKLALSDNPPR